MRTLFFTAAYHTEIKRKIAIFDSLNILFSSFSILEFTNSFNEITIVFQSFKPDSHRTAKEYKTMRRKTKTLELYLILDYEHIMQSTDPENLQHIKEVFLKGCETFLKPLKDFKWKEFEEQLKQIL